MAETKDKPKIIRVWFKDDSYKSFFVFPHDTVEEIVVKVAERMQMPVFNSHFGLMEKRGHELGVMLDDNAKLYDIKTKWEEEGYNIENGYYKIIFRLKKDSELQVRNRISKRMMLKRLFDRCIHSSRHSINQYIRLQKGFESFCYHENIINLAGDHIVEAPTIARANEQMKIMENAPNKAKLDPNMDGLVDALKNRASRKFSPKTDLLEVDDETLLTEALSLNGNEEEALLDDLDINNDEGEGEMDELEVLLGKDKKPKSRRKELWSLVEELEQIGNS